MTGCAQIIVVNVFLSRNKRTLIVEIGQGVDEISIMVLEHHGGLMPLLHHKLVRNIQTAKNQVKNLDIISRRLAVGIKELKRSEVPVADDGQRVILSITIVPLGLSGRSKAEAKEREQYVVESFVHCVVTL